MPKITAEMVKDVFERFDQDGSGSITAAEFRLAMQSTEFAKNKRMADGAIETIMLDIDRSGDNKISYDEFLSAVMDPNHAIHKHMKFYGLLSLVSKFYVKNNHDGDFMEDFTWKKLPFFMFFLTVAEIVVFCYYKYGMDCEVFTIGPDVAAPLVAGRILKLECPITGSSQMAFRPTCREQAWRFLSYMFIHNGDNHITMNAITQLLVGIPLELVHGPLRVMTLYILGALYGSLGSSVFNPLTNVVGASGAVYSILCAHIADTIQNWHEFSFNSKLFHVILLVSFLGLDLGMSINKLNSGDKSVSFTAHACGGFLGAALGTFVLKNKKLEKHEVIIKWVCLACVIIFGVALFICQFALPKDTWNTPGPSNSGFLRCSYGSEIGKFTYYKPGTSYKNAK